MEITKEVLIGELTQIAEQYAKEYPEASTTVTRTYYRIHSKYGTKYERFWGTFAEFKEEANLSQEEDYLNLTKKLFYAQEEISKLQKENKKLLKEVITHDTLLDLYKDNLETEFKYPIITDQVETSTNKVFVLNLSDVHLGEVVEPQYVNFVNEFNKEIAIKRLDSIFNQTIQYSKKIGAFDLFILLNGDLLSGGIHAELSRTNDLNEVESLFYLQRYLCKKISELTEYFNSIDVTVVVGNHARILSGKPYFKEKTTMNYEYILGQQLKLYFDLVQNKEENKKVSVFVPDSPFVIKYIKNLKFLATHGDILTGAGNGGFAGIPFYSICMSGAKLYGVLHQIGINESVQFDHILCGHLHTTVKIPLFNGGFCFVNGCVVGTNEFSLHKMRSVAKKEQLLLIVDDNGIDGEINIRFN